MSVNRQNLTLPAYAKVNYTLDVLGVRSDGYHGIASVMQTVSLADRITLEPAERGIQLECRPFGPADENNLAWRAADSALKEAGSGRGVRIRIEKRIPLQAGLGGGSANAAATLRGVNRLLDLGLDASALARLAAGIGSDVPFFLVGGTAAVRGRGEIVTPLPDGPPLWFVIVMPDAAVSTPEAYAELDRIPDRICARATRKMEELLREGETDRIITRMANDFEQTALERLPIAAAMDDLLMARARNARLCGSGAALFGVAYSSAEAESIARLMRLKYSTVHVSRALTREESLRFGEPIE